MIFTRNFLIFHAVDELSIVIKNIIDMKNNDYGVLFIQCMEKT